VTGFRGYFAAAFLALALIGGGKLIYDRQQQASVARGELEVKRRIERALDQRVQIRVDETLSVQAWLDEFTKQAGMPVRFHHGDGPTLAERRTLLKIDQQSAREALLRLSDEQGFHWHPDEEPVIHLYSPGSTAPVEVWTHRLPVPIHDGAADSLAVLIEDHWPSPHLGAAIVASPGQWIVTQPYDVQLRIEQFLQKLATHLRDVSEMSTQGLLPGDPRLAPLRFDPQPEAAQAIQAALDRRMSLDVVDAPLKDVIAKIAAEAGITIVLTKKIEDAGVHPDQPVTFRANDLGIGAVLKHLLGERNLTYITKEMSLRITTVEDAFAPDHQVMVAYPVPDLTRADEWKGYDELAQLIRCVHWEDWQSFGTGRIYYFRNLLLISNREQVHERITNFFRALRSVRARERRVASLQPASPHRDKTLAILKLPCELKYDNVPLKDIVADIERRTGVPIFLSKKIEDAGVQPDHRITCNLAARPLEENLRRMLAEINLSLAVDDEVVIITTQEHAQSPELVETEVIDLRPLRKPWSPAELVDLIPTVIEPDGWEVIENDRFEFEGLLVIRQRRDVLAQVHHLLRVLEQHTQPGTPSTERGNLLAKMPCVYGEGVRSSLYDVRDLLKPQGKYTSNELIDALNEAPFEPTFHTTERTSVPIYSHSHELISAYLVPGDLEILEARLQQLRNESGN